MEINMSGKRGGRNGLSMNYQPIVNIMFEKTVAYEAFVRLFDTVLKSIPPDLFIPVVEKSDMNVLLEKWIFEETCRMVIKMEKKEIPFEYMAVNTSVKYLKRKSYIKDLLKIMDETGVSPGKFCLEIPESSLVTGDGDIVEKMYELKREGFKIAVDEYGANYLPLSRLDSVPADIIKLERSISDFILTDKKVEEHVSAIVFRANGLNIKTVAKAVETEKQKFLLKNLKCGYMQGFLFGKPVTEKYILNKKQAITTYEEEVED